MKKYVNIILIALFSINFIFIGCKKNEDETTIVVNKKSTISGIVVDEQNLPVTGVTVTAYGSTVTTSTDGAFIFTNVAVENGRYIVNFSKTGYFNISRSGEIAAGGTADILVGMVSKTSTNSGSVTFSATTGGILLINNGVTDLLKIIFPANNFIVESTSADYSGNVNVNAYYVDPSTEGFSKFIDGGDFIGKDTAGTENILQMFSGLKVEITGDAGEILQLKPGTKAAATVEFTIPSALVANAPTNIGIWEYNTSTGQQNQTATSNRNGDKVISEIGHFSSWNCNIGYQNKATVTGYVKDANNSPVAGVKVAVGQNDVYTDVYGKYTCKVPAGTSINVGISDYYGSALVTPAPQNYTLSANETKSINFSVPNMRMISGKLVNCSGSAVVGKVILRWTNNFSTVFSKSDGTFSLPINLGISGGIIYAYGNQTSTYVYVPDTTNSLGNIILCPPVVTGANQFTIIGTTLFPNSKTFSSFNISKTGTYNSMSGTTSIIADGDDGYISMDIPGKSTGQYIIGGATPLLTCFINISAYSFSNDLISGTINVTKYSSVGGLIEGNFTGKITNAGDTATITNGKFSVVRQADYQQPDK